MGDIAITQERWAASVEKQRAEISANPQFADMARAFAPTTAEQAEIEAAQEALRVAEEAVNTFGLAGSRFELEEALLRAQNMRRRLNASVKRVEVARFARRRAAKAKQKSEPAKSRADGWLTVARKKVMG